MKSILCFILPPLLLTLPAALHGADTVNPQELASPSDLLYERHAATPAAGQPIGNGRMGTMIWTSPDAIHLQINRVDVPRRYKSRCCRVSHRVRASRK